MDAGLSASISTRMRLRRRHLFSFSLFSPLLASNTSYNSWKIAQEN